MTSKCHTPGRILKSTWMQKSDDAQQLIRFVVNVEVEAVDVEATVVEVDVEVGAVEVAVNVELGVELEVDVNEVVVLRQF